MTDLRKLLLVFFFVRCYITDVKVPESSGSFTCCFQGVAPLKYMIYLENQIFLSGGIP